VVVLTHNRRAEVLRTLDSLTALAEQPPIIVVDNGSTDGTMAAVGTAFPEVSTLRFAENIGAAARNAGIAMAVTPYVALCDDDTCWQPGSLARAGELLDRFPRLAVVTGTVLVGPTRQLDPTSRLMASSPLPSHAGFPGMAILGFLAGASVIRRAAFLEVGGFEPRFFIGGEETLVAWDLAAAGWQMDAAGASAPPQCPVGHLVEAAPRERGATNGATHWRGSAHRRQIPRSDRGARRAPMDSAQASYRLFRNGRSPQGARGSVMDQLQEERLSSPEQVVQP
jgi:glycosyltransferase involved in cell wall biosynthesis